MFVRPSLKGISCTTDVAFRETCAYITTPEKKKSTPHTPNPNRNENHGHFVSVECIDRMYAFVVVLLSTSNRIIRTLPYHTL